MRYLIQVLALCAATTSALQLPDLQPFLSAIPISISDYFPPATEAIPQEQKHTPQQAQPHHNLFRRQNDDTCPSSYNNCANIGAPGLCCSPSARCSADAAGHVACCPVGAACTGTIGAIVTKTSTGSATGTATETGNSGLLVTASTASSALSTGTGGFVLDGTQTVATPGAGFRGAQPVSGCLSWGQVFEALLTIVPATCCESSHSNAGVPAIVDKLVAYDGSCLARRRNDCTD
jgi:hypothetical protein